MTLQSPRLVIATERPAGTTSKGRLVANVSGALIIVPAVFVPTLQRL